MKTVISTRSALTLFGVLVMLLSAAPVMAHTSLQSSVPEAGKTVSEVKQLTLRFGAPLRLMNLSLTDASGQDIALEFERSATAQSKFDVGIGTPLPASSYQVTWVGMGDDGHKIDGNFGFVVDPKAVSVMSAQSSEKAEQRFSGLDHAAAKVVLAFHAALSSGDAEAVSRLLADNVIIFEGGGVERSRTEYESHHLAADMAFLKNLSVTALEHHVRVYGNSALSMARSSFSGEYKGKPVDHVGMESITLQQREGNWRIAHIHWSN